jgi:hypothetical protein
MVDLIYRQDGTACTAYFIAFYEALRVVPSALDSILWYEGWPHEEWPHQDVTISSRRVRRSLFLDRRRGKLRKSSRITPRKQRRSLFMKGRQESNRLVVQSQMCPPATRRDVSI